MFSGKGNKHKIVSEVYIFRPKFDWGMTPLIFQLLYFSADFDEIWYVNLVYEKQSTY